MKERRLRRTAGMTERRLHRTAAINLLLTKQTCLVIASLLMWTNLTVVEAHNLLILFYMEVILQKV